MHILVHSLFKSVYWFSFYLAFKKWGGRGKNACVACAVPVNTLRTMYFYFPMWHVTYRGNWYTFFRSIVWPNLYIDCLGVKILKVSAACCSNQKTMACQLFLSYLPCLLLEISCPKIDLNPALGLQPRVHFKSLGGLPVNVLFNHLPIGLQLMDFFHQHIKMCAL